MASKEKSNKQKYFRSKSSPKAVSVDLSSTGNGGTNWLRVFPAIIICAVLAAYLNSFLGAFVFDDSRYLSRMPDLAGDQWWAWMAEERRLLVRLTMAVNFWIGGEDPTLYHVFNLVVHGIAALALFGALRRILAMDVIADSIRAAAIPLAFVIALLWAVHPLNTEAVTYIIQRSESMMGMFFLLSLYLAMMSLERSASSRNATQSRIALLTPIAVFLCTVAGMVSKEVMITLPIVVILCDRLLSHWTWREQLVARWPLYGSMALGIAAAFAYWLGFVGLKELAGPVEGQSAGFGLEALSPGEYALTQALVILKYLKLSIWPSPLVLDYMHHAQHTLLDDDSPLSRGQAIFQIVWPVVVVLLLIGATIYGVVKRRPLALCGAAFFVVLSITSSVIPIADIMVERRMYLPLIAVLAALVVIVYSVLHRFVGASGGRVLGGAVAVVMAPVFAAQTFQRNAEYGPYAGPGDKVYSGAVHVWHTVTQRRPSNPRGWHNLGAAYEEDAREHAELAAVSSGDEAAAHLRMIVSCRRYATEAYENVLGLTDRHAPTLNNLGNLYRMANKVDEGRDLVKRAVELEPNDPSYRFNLGEYELHSNNNGEAERHFRAAIELKPEYPAALNNLGVSLKRQERNKEAAEAWRRAIALDDGQVNARVNLAEYLFETKQFDAAERVLREVLQREPGHGTARSYLVGTLMDWSISLAKDGRFEDAATKMQVTIIEGQRAGLDAKAVAFLQHCLDSFHKGEIPKAITDSD